MIKGLLRPAWTLLLAAGAATFPAAAAPQYGERQVSALLEIATAEKEAEGRRAQAVRELEKTELRSHLPALRRLMREERSLDIRLSAACVLVALGDRSAPRDLLLATAYDGERTPHCSRGDVLLALGRLGDPAGVLHLERALRNEAPADEPEYHADACRALAALETPAAHRVLAAALRDGAEPLRATAVTPLSRVARGRSPERLAARQALLMAARQDPAERVAEQAASALFWDGVDGPGFYNLLERDPEPRVRARAARVMNRHYLTPPRVQRLRAALGREQHPEVRSAMEKTLQGQAPDVDSGARRL